jgi:iron complex outermembrane receptor protein
MRRSWCWRTPGRRASPCPRTTGGRAAAALGWGDGVTVTVGADLQENSHSLRSTMNQRMTRYESLPHTDDAWFRSTGLFAEANFALAERSRLVAGLRADLWRAKDERSTVTLGMMGSMPNPTAGIVRDDTLSSGFARLEHDLAAGPATVFVGLGHVERFPDYWELVSAGKESVDSLSAFRTEPERTTQLDAGIVYSGQRLSGSVSAYFGGVKDFILIQGNYPKGMRRTTVTRNVDARTWGGEVDASYALARRWGVSGALAWSAGDNDTDDVPLARMPPLDVRAGLDYEADRWFVGALWRVVAQQDRYAVDQGSVVGQDLGRTGGFGVVSLHGGWRAPAGAVVTAGVDNLFDKEYAEHVSRAGAMVAGYEQTSRVNEPGRTLWIKVAASFGESP